jgi:uncharacterized phage protein (predicted DNA packaging)
LIVTLDEIKKYLRLDEISDDDELINSLLLVADEYVKSATGFLFADPAKTPERAKHVVKLLVAHWYEMRTPVIAGNGVSVVDVPYTISILLTQLSYTHSEEVIAT